MANWWWKADYIETCNCAHACSCNITMLPTDGTCQAIDAWKIREGEYDGTKLDSFGIALIVRWPNPIHKGNGKAVVYIDERADTSQREALEKIGTGQAGDGGPFAIFSTTYSEPPKVVYGPFQFEREGRQGNLVLGDLAKARIGPVLSDMDQTEADVHFVMPQGFIFRDGRIVNTDSCEVNAPGLSFRHENSSAFFSEVQYNV